MVKNIGIVLFITLLSACSISNKLERRYEGNGREILMQDFGEPQRIVDLPDGKQKFIYLKETYIRATEIGTGKGTLDPRVSPGFIKEETFKFIIDTNGVVVDSEYERKEK